MKAIIIGRHDPSGKEGIEMIEQRAINFPATSGDCYDVLYPLFLEAVEKNVKLIFQAIPVQVAVAIANIIDNDSRFSGRIGGIVNTPGERPAGVSERFFTDAPQDANSIREAVLFANPRAKTSLVAGGCEVVVDPPLRFKFSHIEWF